MRIYIKVLNGMAMWNVVSLGNEKIGDCLSCIVEDRSEPNVIMVSVLFIIVPARRIALTPGVEISVMDGREA